MFRMRTVCRSRAQQPSRIRFLADRRGNVAMLFGLLSFVTFTFIGAAVDMGRWLQARRVTMDAMESATLAGLRAYQESNSDAAVAEAQALLNYRANTMGRPPVSTDTVSFKLENSGSTIAMKALGNAEYQTLFLAVMPTIMNVKSLPMLRTDNSEHPVSKLAVGQNSGTNLEVAMMLDITGSMGSYDNSGKKKIDSLKEAAKKLIDIVIWDDQSQYTSKVSLVPFSEAVNLGSTRANAARGPKPADISAKDASGSTRTWKASNDCVTERMGTYKYTDVSLSTAPSSAHRSRDGSCATKSILRPLDNDKSMLKGAIDAFVESGFTAGQIGTEWAWYTLSPNMNSLWGNSKNNARPYSDVTAKNAKGRPVLNKIAVLMTDGEYNMQYCSTNIPDKNSGPSNSSKGNCTAANATSQSQALSVCSAMKGKGITVYTVGFMVGTNEKTLLTSCATSPEHFYDASDGAQLLAAFTDIAYKLVPPYVAH